MQKIRALICKTTAIRITHGGTATDWDGAGCELEDSDGYRPTAPANGMRCNISTITRHWFTIVFDAIQNEQQQQQQQKTHIQPVPAIVRARARARFARRYNCTGDTMYCGAQNKNKIDERGKSGHDNSKRTLPNATKNERQKNRIDDNRRCHTNGSKTRIHMPNHRPKGETATTPHKHGREKKRARARLFETNNTEHKSN